MLSRSVASVLLLVLRVVAQPSSGASVDSTVPNHYIVEFSEGILPRDLTSDNLVTLIKSYTSPLFTGALIQVQHDADATTYASSPHVAAIWPNHRVALDTPLDVQGFLNDVAATNYSVHGATGVDKLHAAGIRGHGARVGIVDSGVWYKHPALGGGFGPGFKVAGGWDFVGDSPDPNAPKNPDADPLDTPDVGHGTHVAGIVAGLSDNFVGVAPDATLFAYKVFGAYEGTDDATLIDAWLRAYDDGMDVITTSISGLVGWSQNAAAVVASRVAQAGVIMTFSAGNNGLDGPFYGVSAGSSPDVLTIASVQAAVSPASRYQLIITYDGVSNTTTSGYLPSDENFPPEVKDWPIIALSYDIANPSDACTAPSPTVNLTGAVALVRRGGCSFVEKQQILQPLGAKYILVYNDDRPLTNPGTTLDGSLLAMLTAEAGHAIIHALEAGANVTADFSQPGGEVGQVDYMAGSTPNSFSSWAATYDLQIKPDIAAPGGNIFSTWPGDGYMVMSGTSMATPYIAGIAALYVSAHGGRNVHGAGFAADFNRRVVAAGVSLTWFNGTVKSPGLLAPPLQMGGGLVNASRVLFTETTVDTTKFALNDTANFQPSHDVTVTNNGTAAVAYRFALEPAAGVEIQNPYVSTAGTWGINKFADLKPKNMTPDVVLPADFTLGPGESKTVTITFANPEAKGWNATLIPAYSGKVVLAGDNGEQLSMLYMGIASDLYAEKKVFKSNYPVSFSGNPWQSIETKATYTFNVTADGSDFPMLFTAFDWGVRELRWDIFEPNWPESKWEYPLTPASGFLGAVTRFTGDTILGHLADPSLANQTLPMPATFLTRAGMYQPFETKYWWLGNFANGSRIVPGNYTMRVAASRPFGDLGRVESWEVWRREIQVLPLV